jgi:hypothetical protein
MANLGYIVGTFALAGAFLSPPIIGTPVVVPLEVGTPAKEYRFRYPYFRPPAKGAVEIYATDGKLLATNRLGSLEGVLDILNVNGPILLAFNERSTSIVRQRRSGRQSVTLPASLVASTPFYVRGKDLCLLAERRNKPINMRDYVEFRFSLGPRMRLISSRVIGDYHAGVILYDHAVDPPRRERRVTAIDSLPSEELKGLYGAGFTSADELPVSIGSLGSRKLLVGESEGLIVSAPVPLGPTIWIKRPHGYERLTYLDMAKDERLLHIPELGLSAVTQDATRTSVALGLASSQRPGFAKVAWLRITKDRPVLTRVANGLLARNVSLVSSRE